MTNDIWTPTVDNCDTYLGERTGKYEQRAFRYRAAADAMSRTGVVRDPGHGLITGTKSELDDTMTVMDIGAGWTEFDYTLRAEYGWKGRYIPIDGGIDGTDLNTWAPPRRADWFVALEILEHVHDWQRLAGVMMMAADKGVIFSTPNPETTDVLGMDDTHVVEVHAKDAIAMGFTVKEATFYGGRFSNGQPDSLFGVWRA